MATQRLRLALRPCCCGSHALTRTTVRWQSSTSPTTNPFDEDPNLVASRTAPRSYPPPSLRSQPRPKISRASQRTSQPTREKLYPDKRPAPKVLEMLEDSQCAPNLPYYVTRTPSNELPIYHIKKAGGNKPLTRIRKIDGSPLALRDALQEHFGFKKDECVVNSLAQQVIVKGHVREQIEAFLTARKF